MNVCLRAGGPFAGRWRLSRRSLDERPSKQYIEAIVASFAAWPWWRRNPKGAPMQVREGMSPTVLTVGPGHTLRDAARLMSERKVGAAVVIDPDAGGIGIV